LWIACKDVEWHFCFGEYSAWLLRYSRLLEFSAAHWAFFFYCIFDVWKLDRAVEAEVNLAFQAAMEPATYHFSASITRLDKSTIKLKGYIGNGFKKQGVKKTNNHSRGLVKSGRLRARFFRGLFLNYLAKHFPFPSI
jgi:hypothetical protein